MMNSDIGLMAVGIKLQKPQIDPNLPLQSKKIEELILLNSQPKKEEKTGFWWPLAISFIP